MHASSHTSPRDAKFDSLILEQVPHLRRFANRFAKTHADREDLIQDTVMRALGAAHQYAEGTHLRSWLFTIMRNTFCSTYKRRSKEVIGIDDDFMNHHSIAAPQEWAIRVSEITAAVDKMPEGMRQALIMVSSGESYIDTAEACQCEIGTVKSRINRARTYLEEKLGSLH